MATTIPLTDNWSIGQVSDVAPNRLKPNSAISLRNLVPDWMNSPLALRGGFEYAYIANPDFTSFSASTTGVKGSVMAPFQDGNKLLFLDQAGRILSINTSGVGSLLDSTGIAEVVAGQPFFHLDKEIIVGGSGTKFPWNVTTNGSGVAAAAAYADPFPKATVGTSWGAYLLLANGGDFANSYAINQRRLWFSNPGLFTFTAANNSYWDFPALERIVAVVGMANSIIVFGPRSCEILTGDTPPPNNNLTRRPLYPYGVCDETAIKLWNGYIIFANERGLFKTDGTSLVDLTEQAGLINAWRTDFYNFGGSSTCAVGIFENFAVITVTNGTTETFTYIYDLVNEIGYHFAGFNTVMYAEVNLGPHAATYASEQDLVFGLQNLGQAGRMQPVFDTSTTAGKDANGAVINFELVTPLYELGGLMDKRLRRLYLSYLWDNSSPHTETPIVEYNIVNNPYASPSWTSMTFPPSGNKKEPSFVNDKGRWVQFRIRGGTAAGIHNLSLFGLELEGHARSSTRSS